MRSLVPAAVATLALGLAACGGSSGGGDQGARTVTVSRPVTRAAAADVPPPAAPGRFDPRAIYRREAAGVVTVISVFPGQGVQSLLGGGSRNQEGLGSGFVLSAKGEIATNAHVVTSGEGSGISRAEHVYVKFGDGNEVPARIVGTDPNADVALLRIDPTGLSLRPLPLGTTDGLVVGDPVAAIGSPFGEPQSLSVGVISALGRTIDSLNNFSISGALQTDAAINHGNSGGPLVDAAGRVLGINSQIESTGGGGEGVGFAVPVDAVKRSLTQLRDKGTAAYAYLGVSTAPVYPQLAQHFHLSADRGAWIQSATANGAADRANIHGGDRTETFQAETYRVGGDVITAVDGQAIRNQDDLSRAIARHAPGDVVTIAVYSGSRRHDVRVKLGARPANQPSAP